MMKTSIMDIDTEVVEDVEDIDVDTGVDVDGIYVNSPFFHYSITMTTGIGTKNSSQLHKHT